MGACGGGTVQGPSPTRQFYRISERLNRKQRERAMSNDASGLAATLATIEAKIAKLQSAADTIRELMAAEGIESGGPSGGPGGGVKPGAFLTMSIPDAAKKHLESMRQKVSTGELIKALVKGGLPESKYNTVYSILRRRERQVGDIINMQGDWALAEWYPNYRKGKATTKEAENGTAVENEEAKATA